MRGAVIDAYFASGELPAIEEALIVEKGAGEEIYAEVQAHLDRHNVRALALQSTVGLSRGRRVRRTGGPIEISVGDATLGRLIDVVGQTGDQGPAPARRRAAPRNPSQPARARAPAERG